MGQTIHSADKPTFFTQERQLDIFIKSEVVLKNYLYISFGEESSQVPSLTLELFTRTSTMRSVTGDFEDSASSDGKVPKNRKKRKIEAERHAIITMMTVIIFFIVTYTPSFLTLFIRGFYQYFSEANTTGRGWVVLMIDYGTFINSTFLPMVHFSRSHGFKRQLRSLKTKGKSFICRRPETE